MLAELAEASSLIQTETEPTAERWVEIEVRVSYLTRTRQGFVAHTEELEFATWIPAGAKLDEGFCARLESSIHRDLSRRLRRKVYGLVICAIN